MTSDTEGSGMAGHIRSTQFTIFICNVLKESLKFGIHTFSDPAEFDTHQCTCSCMCLNKKNIGRYIFFTDIQYVLHFY